MSVYLIVFVLYFLVIIATSVMGAKKVESMEDFAVGGNKMGLILGVGTSMATWLSVASVMGVPGNVYSRGICAVTGWFAGWCLSTALHIGISYKVRRPAIPTRTFPEFAMKSLMSPPGWPVKPEESISAYGQITPLKLSRLPGSMRINWPNR